jgi:hypothetical protein
MPNYLDLTGQPTSQWGPLAASPYAPQMGAPSASGISDAMGPGYQSPQQPSLLSHIAGAAGDVAAWPKQQFRGLAGLDPKGSSFDDLQNLGVPRVPAAWAGSALDTLADPSMLAGMAAKGGSALLNKLGGSPAVQGLMAGESGAVDLDKIRQRLDSIRSMRTPTPAASDTVQMASPVATEARFDRVMGNTKLGLAIDTKTANQNALLDRLSNLRKDPEALSQVMKPIPVGAQYQGSGVEATVLRNPESSQVYRIAQGNGSLRGANLPPEPRLNLPEILQPNRPDVVAGNIRMETLPYARVGQDVPEDYQAARDLYQSLRNRGYVADDLLGRVPNNIGWLDKGGVGGRGPGVGVKKPYVIDPGFIKPETQINGGQAAVPTGR